MDLQKVLGKHKKWLETVGSKGKKANLRGANLSGANLSGADLRRADLHRADLRRADLCGADLCGANLCFANLCFANLSDANLRGADLRGAIFVETTGFILLPAQDPRGYSWSHATLTDDGWKIRAGCRDFSIEEAKAHWGESYDGDREIGDMYLYAIEWLEKKLARESE